MPKLRFSDVFVVIGTFVIYLVALLRFLLTDTGGSLLCLSIFLTFFTLFGVCFRRGINPVGLLPRIVGQPLCGVIAALLLYFAWSEEGLTKDALIATSIIIMVMTLLYPLFSVFSDSPTKRTPSTPPASPPASPEAPQPTPPKKYRNRGKRRRRY